MWPVLRLRCFSGVLHRKAKELMAFISAGIIRDHYRTWLIYSDQSICVGGVIGAIRSIYVFLNKKYSSNFAKGYSYYVPLLLLFSKNNKGSLPHALLVLLVFIVLLLNIKPFGLLILLY